MNEEASHIMEELFDAPELVDFDDIARAYEESLNQKGIQPSSAYLRLKAKNRDRLVEKLELTRQVKVAQTRQRQLEQAPQTVEAIKTFK